jgi:RNA polymerase sigma-70 factor (ECF subfamily)
MEFQQTYEQTKNMVYRLVWRMIKNKTEAEDITQEVFIKVYKNLDKFNPQQAKLTTWVYQIALNHTLNHIKRGKWLRDNWDKVIEWYDGRHQENLESDPTAQITEASHIEELLGKVPVDFRTCVVLKDLEDLSYEEISSHLKIPVGTVRSRISRGREMLKKLYEKEEHHE